jgi:2-deoxy-D-gluconate 3-dehydrogenase
MRNPFDLSDRVALVTGGNGGIGFGMAKGLAEAGATVVIAGRNPEKNSRAVAELKELGSDAMSVEVDVLEEASIASMIDIVIERRGRIDILIANAGTNVRKMPEDYSLDEWHK